MPWQHELYDLHEDDEKNATFFNVNECSFTAYILKERCHSMKVQPYSISWPSVAVTLQNNALECNVECIVY